MAAITSQVMEGFGVMAAVVNAKSFVGAGEALGMTQSGVSRSIARLEETLGIRLFERTTRSVRLTDEGRRLYEQVVPLIGALEEATHSASGTSGSIRGKLRVNVDPFFSRLILGPRLGAFLESHPELEMELRTSDHLGDLVADGFDLAIRFGHPQSSSLIARKLLDARIVTVAAPAYLRRYGYPRDPQELQRRPGQASAHQCIQFRDSATGRPFPWEFHQRRKKIIVETSGSLTLNDAGTLQSVCLAGYGIAQMFELTADPVLTSKKLVNLFPEWSDERFPLYAYYPSRNHVPARIRALVDFVASLVS
jgi:DNA-binding transcriptional LysR family regulator